MVSYKDYLKELERIANDDMKKHIDIAPLENERELLDAELAKQNQENNELSVKFNELQNEYRKLKYQHEREENEKEQLERAERYRQQKQENARKAAEKERKAEEERKRIEQSNKWAEQGLCRHCGGKMGGLFTKKCKSCGKES